MNHRQAYITCAAIWIAVALSIVVVRYSESWWPKIDGYSLFGTPYEGEENTFELDLAAIDTTISLFPELPEIVEDTYPEAETYGLDAFFEALPTTDEQAIRVVHYGDSQIEEDRITSVLRRHLQDTYGGTGLGLIPMHQTIPTRTLKQRLYLSGEQQNTGGGPKRYLAYGPRSMRMDTTLYGPMGQVAIMDNDIVAGSEDALLQLTLLKPKNYPTFSKHSEVRLLADSGIIMTQDSAGIHLQGRGRVYGLSLQGPTGVYVDNIPMRGCAGMVFTGIDSQQLRDYFRTTNTRLIILQFGGNFIAGTHSEQGIRNAVKGLTQQVRHIHKLAPEASILFIGPADMLRNEHGELVSDPYVSLMDNLLRQMAESERIAYYSLYHAMGGEGSMREWQQRGWAAKDGIHFSQQGAEVAGEDLWSWLERQRKEFYQD